MIENLIVEIEKGPYKGYKFWLLPGQNARVGCSAYADYTYHDRAMSGVHCLFQLDSTTCFIRDLNSRTGTFVNGRLIDYEQELQHGDLVRVGQTVFRVFVDGWSERVQPASEASPSVGMEYEQDTLISGLNRYVPTVPSSFLLGELIPRFLEGRHGFAMIQMKVFSIESLPTYLDQIVHLSADVGLLELSTPELTRQIVRTLQGKRAVSFIGSNHSLDSVVAQLRYMTGIYRDNNLLIDQLENGQEVFVKGLTNNMDGIVLEHPDGIRWNLYSSFPFGDIVAPKKMETPAFMEPQQ